jgi:hypothetical protein
MRAKVILIKKIMNTTKQINKMEKITNFWINLKHFYPVKILNNHKRKKIKRMMILQLMNIKILNLINILLRKKG